MRTTTTTKKRAEQRPFFRILKLIASNRFLVTKIVKSHLGQ